MESRKEKPQKKEKSLRSATLALPQVLYAKKIVGENNQTPLAGVEEITFERKMDGLGRSIIQCQVQGYFSKSQEQNGVRKPVSLSLFQYFQVITPTGLFPLVSGKL